MIIMDPMKAILTREIERLNETSKKQPLSKDEIANLDKLASAWNKYYGKDLAEVGQEMEEVSIEDAIAIARSGMSTELEVTDGGQEEDPKPSTLVHQNSHPLGSSI